jgi:hypothetical protein
VLRRLRASCCSAVDMGSFIPGLIAEPSVGSACLDELDLALI